MYFSIIFALMIFLPVFVIPFFTEKKRAPYRVIMGAVIVTLAAVAVVLGVANLTGEPLNSQFMDRAETISRLVADDANASKMMGMSELDYMGRVEYLLLVYDMISKLMPAMCVILTSITAYFSYIILYKTPAKRRFEMSHLAALRYFSWSPKIIIATFFITIIAFLLDKTAIFGNLALYQNVILLFEAGLTLQGLAVYLFYAKLKKFSPIVKNVILVILLLTGIGRTALLIIGALDILFSLRTKIFLKHV